MPGYVRKQYYLWLDYLWLGSVVALYRIAGLTARTLG